MRARYARQIRAGIEAAHLPHRLRALWVIQAMQKRPPELTVRAYKRTYDKMPTPAESWAQWKREHG